MVAKFDLTDDSVVVVIGTGAGGGVVSNELAQKGVKVVALEAGGRYLPEDYINDEWESFGQLAWTDPRTTSGDWRVAKDFSGLPAWIVKAVGGTTIHWAGASLRFQDHEWKAKTTYGEIEGANLLDWPIDAEEMAPWYDKAEAKLGVTRTGDRAGLPGNNNFKVLVNLASNEYFGSVRTDRLDARVVSPRFLDEKDGQFKVMAFFAKRARGAMTGWLIRERIKSPKALTEFDGLGYHYDPARSTPDEPVFVRPEAAR